MAKGRIVKETPRLLWVGDAVAHTGFSSVTHGILNNLYSKYDVHVLAINYFGDPHDYPYKIYPAATGGDLFGINRLPTLMRQIRPNIVCVINDPWVVRDYIQGLNTPVGKAEDGTELFSHKVSYMPIDGLNIQQSFIEPLNEMDANVFYTEFGLEQAKLGGLTNPNTAVIPHAIETADFAPQSKAISRKKLMGIPEDWYIVGCVNRNQPRKRIDLAMQYFAEWAADKPENVKFYYHGSLQDIGWNIGQMAKAYGIHDRLIITSPNMTAANGVPRSILRDIYCSFDVQISTTLGEGWGLTQMEGMSCGTPQIVPNWSGLGEWAAGGVEFVECTAMQMHTGGLNTIGGVADKQQFIAALERMYTNKDHRDTIGKAGLDLVSQPKFRWFSVAKEFDKVFTKVMYGGNT